MLTADLLRARVRKGVVKPTFVEPSKEVHDRAAQLIRAYEDRVGRERGVIQNDVDAIVGHGTDFLLWRGLAKLCDDRSKFETVSSVDPVELRRALFEHNFAGGPPRADKVEAVVGEVAASLEINAEQCREAMYADRIDRQLLTEFAAIDADELIDRYNLALAQAVLYRAVRLSVRLARPEPDRLRYLFGVLKFHGLMHRAHRDGEVLVVDIDGPASLFKLSRKYGLKMAVFLPALVLLDDWELEADLDWKKKERKFLLSSKDALRSHYRARGQWRTEEEKWFEQRFPDAKTDWEIERRGSVLELRDGEVLVTDYVLTAPDGREVFVEIVSFWRAAYLRRRIDWLGDADVPLVLVVSERLKADREKLDSTSACVVFYKGVIVPAKVVESAEAALAAFEARS